MGVLVSVAEKYLDLNREYDQLVLHALKCSRKFDMILKASKFDFLLEPQTQSELRQVTQHYLTSVAELALRSHRAELAMWNWTIKFHCLFHVAEQGGRLHPSLVWNYSQEGFLQHIRVLVQGNRNRKSVFNITMGVMEKWCAGEELALQANWVV